MLVPYCSEVKDYYCPFLGLQFQKSHHNLQSFISKCLFVCLFVFLFANVSTPRDDAPPSHSPTHQKKFRLRIFFCFNPCTILSEDARPPSRPLLMSFSVTTGLLVVFGRTANALVGLLVLE